MCYDDTVHELARAVRKYVQFKDSAHARAVAKGRCLPMSDPTTNSVYAEAERLYDKFQGMSSKRPRRILAGVGIANSSKGRDCRGTKLSAIREAIYECAAEVADVLEAKAAKAEKRRRKKWKGPLVTTDAWVAGERPRRPETIRYGWEDELSGLADPWVVATIGEVCAT